MSQSYQDKLTQQTEQLKRDQEQQMLDYQRIVRESHLFRTTYAAKMTEILD